MSETFTEEQKQYLQGFAVGSGLNRSLPVLSEASAAPAELMTLGPDGLQRAAQDRFLAAGGKITPEESAKRETFGLDIWDEIVKHSRDGRFPKGTDVLLFKFQGMFYVAPAQNSFMCRLRFPGGIVTSSQLSGVADLSARFGGGSVDLTTRSNLQIRDIGPMNTVHVLMGLSELGIINKGAGADNIRNITASPTAGIDPQELIDVRPLARRMHHHILNHREMYGLPRKFNIAFDGGGTISALEDTNDIGFTAVKVNGEVLFRMALGGITGHKDFARDAGIVMSGDDCIEVAAAVVRVFLDHGDRTDRKKARLKYLLDSWGHEKFLAETQRVLGRQLRKLPIEPCDRSASPTDRLAHIGVHPQKQPGLHYVGVVLPVGRLTADQARGLGRIADQFGNGELRLTVWQNLLLPNIPEAQTKAVTTGIEKLGLHWSAANVRAGLVACTGSAGCKFAASNTKAHALQTAAALEQRLELDVPINIHFTGCHHSCAQHYVGDIGLIGTKVGEDQIEGYNIFVGGGYGQQQKIAREFYSNVPAAEVPATIERLIRAYQTHREAEQQSFSAFINSRPVEEIIELSLQAMESL